MILSSILKAFDKLDFEGDLLLEVVSFDVYKILTTYWCQSADQLNVVTRKHFYFAQRKKQFFRDLTLFEKYLPS